MATPRQRVKQEALDGKRKLFHGLRGSKPVEEEACSRGMLLSRDGDDGSQL
jgi:hypothetical protein